MVFADNKSELNGKMEMTSVSSVRKKGFKVDLNILEGAGDFPCPQCGTLISPDDWTEKVYTVLSIIVHDDDLERVIIQCGKCNSTITLDGFTTFSGKDGS